DARREMPGWNLPGFDDRTWSGVEVVAPLTPRLEAQRVPPIRVVETAKPVALTNPKPGVWVYDMGVQLFGYARLKVDAPAGTVLTLRYVESLWPDGTRYELNRMACNQADVYVCKGGGEEWTPSFTEHAFRYVQVEGFPGQPELEMLEGRSIANDIAPAQHFECSNELLNRIHAMFVRTALQAAQHKFGSDTARERSCWLGNAPLMYWIYGFDAWTLYEKTMADMDYHQFQRRVGGKMYSIPRSIILEPRVSTYPEGVLASIRIFWDAYLYTGNLQLLEHLYPRMRETMQYMAAMAPEGIYDSWLGDWHDALPKGADSISADGSTTKLRGAARKRYDGPYGGAGGFPANTSPAIPPTARLYECARNMAEAARLLGKPEDGKEYEQLAQRIKSGFIAKFYDPDKSTFGSQTANAAALWLGLIPPGSETKVLESLVADIKVTHKEHFSTGIFGTPLLLQVLLDCGRDDVAYALMTQEDFPSFGLMIAHGATTSWETWGEAILENTPEGNSPPFNASRPQSHLQFLGVDAFFLQGIAGIQRDDRLPGFQGIVLKPHLVRQLEWARADFHSVRGVITSDWKRQGDQFSWKVVVPPNTTATAFVPAKDTGAVLENGKVAAQATGVKFLREEGGAAVFELQSGRYAFQSEL
ncbi:MAG: glycoside hydrolase family 78 protein, partial [Kiritimatiellales bacterium]|nr:glycoside hydrolase family 78 protein [Kiritimatiellales bacterium]